MKPFHKGLVLAVCHVALVASLGLKLHLDRARFPRVWARSGPVDPHLPIRGRYVQLTLEVEADATPPFAAALRVEGDKLVAVPDAEAGQWVNGRGAPGPAFLSRPVAYFIPENALDPSRRPAAEELWVEVTVPGRGPPRPIRLGVRRNGVLTPLDLR